MKTAILFVVMLLVLIIPHEWGHLIVAKLCGVRVNEFSVGMGPLLFKKQKGETQYSVRLLPLGGYCSLEGEEEAVDDPRSYSSKTPLQKIAILLAGVTMNIIIAILAMTLAYAISGIPSNTLSAVTPDSPAAEAGLQAGDTIIEIDGIKIRDWNSVVTAVDGYHEGDKMEIVYRRDGKTQEVFLTPDYDEENQRYMVGVVAGTTRNPLMCIKSGFTSTWEMNRMMLMTFQSMIRKGVKSDDVAGPVGLVRVVGQASSYGIASYLMLLALVSLNLAIFNIIPIPGLDGGKIFFILLKLISGGRITDDMEYKATVAGMALLLALFVLVTYNDIMNIFR
ncbi:MAG: RIP metalloprotease RseP [Mogibacterium sp.]|nr:RIP metalloprotease RseP [Mogibacterium sp.]